MQDEIKIGDRIKLEHIKSNSFIDSVVVDFREANEEGNNFPYVELPGDVVIYWGDGWERVA